MTDDALATLLDERAIERLLTTYGFLNDNRDFDGLADLLTDDCSMSLPSDPETALEGRDAVLSRFRARPPRIARHLSCNVAVNFDGAKRASVRSYSLLVSRREGSQAVVSVSVFDDEVVKNDERWRFRARVGRPLV